MEEVKELAGEPQVEATPPVSEYADEAGKFVTFRSGSEYFALKIEYVNEIIVLQEITVIPESVDYIKGLINLRGKIIPVIDVRVRFKQEPAEYTDRTCIIVVSFESMVVGLIVEQIAEVVDIAAEDIMPPPSFGHAADKVQNQYVYAIGKIGDSVKLLLDPDKLLNDEDKKLLTAEDDELESGEGEV